MLDYEGLQVAYLGVALAHYLDVETGDILDAPLDAEPPGDADRFRRIPTRTPESDDEDRRLFVLKPEVRAWRAQIEPFVEDNAEFRRALQTDRRVERLFFNFKADQATRAIEAWAREQGLS